MCALDGEKGYEKRMYVRQLSNNVTCHRVISERLFMYTTRKLAVEGKKNVYFSELTHTVASSFNLISSYSYPKWVRGNLTRAAKISLIRRPGQVFFPPSRYLKWQEPFLENWFLETFFFFFFGYDYYKLKLL